MFIISKLAIALISPLGSTLFGGLLALLLGFAGRRRLALGLGVPGSAMVLEERSRAIKEIVGRLVGR